jgi:hypothetical protein
MVQNWSGSGINERGCCGLKEWHPQKDMTTLLKNSHMTQGQQLMRVNAVGTTNQT